MLSSSQVGGRAVWQERKGAVEVRFVGRGPEEAREGVLASVAPDGTELAWLKQVHSADVVDARAGRCGEGDALVTRRAGLALGIATADCVPVLFAAEGEVAAAHAGWRGIVAGVVGETLARLAAAPDRMTAWIGPAIGPCCYEVSDEVAERIAAASRPEVLRPGRGDRPHADLPAAVAAQLRAAGIAAHRTVERCTRCHPSELSSYRRDGQQAGRNLAFVWLRPQPLAPST